MSDAVDVLLAEDNPNDADLALRAFKSSGSPSVHWVRDGEEVLEYVFRTGRYADRTPGDPRVILLDLKMPFVDGLEVLGRLKADPKTRSIPIVAMTSSTEQGDIAASYDLGVNSYVVKPVDYDTFLDVVREIGSYWLGLNTSRNGSVS